MILALLIATLFNTVSSNSVPCSGTTYSVPFPYGATAGTPDLVVAAGGVTLAYPSAWTINKVSSASTGTVTLATACTGTVTITRTTPRTQTVNFATQGKLDTSVLTATLDRIEMQMQESVAQGGSATLSSLVLTTPLPVASGGTGAAPPNCGAGVLTSNGTSFSCVTLSGLAPPGTTGVLLQSVTPGSAQVGHLNINGTGSIGVVAANQYNTQGNTNSVAFYNSGTGIGAGTPFYKFDVAQSVGSAPYNNTQPYIRFFAQGSRWMDIMLGRIDLSPLDAGNGGSWSCPVGSEGCITGRWLGLLSSGTAIITDTKPFAVANGSALLAMRNNNVAKFQINGDGSIPLVGGITSSGAISGTTLTSSGLATLASATVTGVSTHTGTTALNGGATIGTSGTAISGSFRGTLAVGSATLGAGLCATQNIPVTGSAVGADCAWTSSIGEADGILSQCRARAGFCDIRTCNYTGAGIGLPAQTLSCRVFNP